MAEGPLMTFAGLLRVGLSPDAMQLEKLQSMDFRQWLAERDQAIAPYLAQLFRQIGADSLREVTIESERDGVAVASIDIGGSKKKGDLRLGRRVLGAQVTRRSMGGLGRRIGNRRRNRILLASVMAASVVLQPIAPSLDSLASATDAGSYHSAMESVFTPAETIVPAIAAMLGKNMSLAGQGNNAYGYDQGYGDDMSDYYDSMDDYGDDMSSDYEDDMSDYDDDMSDYSDDMSSQ